MGQDDFLCSDINVHVAWTFVVLTVALGVGRTAKERKMRKALRTIPRIFSTVILFGSLTGLPAFSAMGEVSDVDEVDEVIL